MPPRRLDRCAGQLAWLPSAAECRARSGRSVLVRPTPPPKGLRPQARKADPTGAPIDRGDEVVYWCWRFLTRQPRRDFAQGQELGTAQSGTPRCRKELDPTTPARPIRFSCLRHLRRCGRITHREAIPARWWRAGASAISTVTPKYRNIWPDIARLHCRLRAVHWR